MIIGHLDRTFTSPDQALRLAQTGCVLEWDFFGIESSYYPFSDLDMPNDAGRLKMIKAVVAAGHGDRVLMARTSARAPACGARAVTATGISCWASCR